MIANTILNRLNIRLLYKCTSRDVESAFLVESKYVIKYKKFSIAKPNLKHSGIFTFNSLKNAEEWRQSIITRKGIRIWLCLGFVGKNQPDAIPATVNTDTVRTYWNRKNAFSNIYGCEPPQGTVVCNKIILLKEV